MNHPVTFNDTQNVAYRQYLINEGYRRRNGDNASKELKALISHLPDEQLCRDLERMKLSITTFFEPPLTTYFDPPG